MIKIDLVDQYDILKLDFVGSNKLEAKN